MYSADTIDLQDHYILVAVWDFGRDSASPTVSLEVAYEADHSLFGSVLDWHSQGL